MMNALQTLVENGCSEDIIERILKDVISTAEDDKRCCVAMLHDWQQGNKNDPDCYSICRLHGKIVDAPGAEYLVLNYNEANAACREQIEVWTFKPSFLAGETGFDQSVFETLIYKCEDSNDAIRSLIDATCGIDNFVQSAIDTNGRGHFLSMDGEEYEVSGYYVYRTN